jgi:hypothetical protein
LTSGDVGRIKEICQWHFPLTVTLKSAHLKIILEETIGVKTDLLTSKVIQHIKQQISN